MLSFTGIFQISEGRLNLNSDTLLPCSSVQIFQIIMSLRQHVLKVLTLAISLSYCSIAFSQPLQLNEQEYFERPGVNVMVFHDFYPEGHQGGVSIIQNGVRLASNGDVRLEPTPGQWQPVPVQHQRVVDPDRNQITVRLSYPDSSRHRKGFNPIIYPDLHFVYQVRVTGEGEGFRITVDLDEPLPEEWIGKVGFNLELFPGDLFGKSWYMDDASGLFPLQANGPVEVDADNEFQPVPLAAGKRLTVAPETESHRLIIESISGDLYLYDGRNKHNNGWFIVRSLIPSGATEGAIEWLVYPHAVPGWMYSPVVHVSQVGYHPDQEKMAIIEQDASDTAARMIRVKRVLENGGFEEVLSGQPITWGRFLRYNYFRFDFSEITRPGLYVIEYGDYRTHAFRIATDVYSRHVWQPTLEYFLPVQMCHMRVEEQYRVWHGACHLDDARMAPVDTNHFDGYVQGASTLTRFKPGEFVPGLDRGGWHDAGDDDFRIESQADEVFILASAYEAFAVEYDETTIDQQQRLVKIHQPDGKPDLLQQVEHGILTILGGYKSLGRLYRGVIVPTLKQYVLIGDVINSTDNLYYDPTLGADERTATHSGVPDDRWVFTEQHPGHEYKGIAALAIAGRVLEKYNPSLARESISAAEALWNVDRDPDRNFSDRITAAVELFLTTKKQTYAEVLLNHREKIVERIGSVGWTLGRALPLINDKTFSDDIRNAVARHFAKIEAQQRKNPFGVPYEPVIWGAGWGIQSFGVQQYFLHRGFPAEVSPEYMLNALNFVLGVHPGVNTASFASGVGSRSVTAAYGLNRADWSYIPGGVVSGTALIRPDFPELKEFPYLWQQAEYVMGGGASNFMFLVLAAEQILNE